MQDIFETQATNIKKHKSNFNINFSSCKFRDSESKSNNRPKTSKISKSKTVNVSTLADSGIEKGNKAMEDIKIIEDQQKMMVQEKPKLIFSKNTYLK